MSNTLYITGVVFLVIGMIGVAALFSDKEMTDAVIAAIGIIAGLLLIGFGTALEKLSQIEQHLRPPSNKIG